jgi:hypothetical protein
LKLFTYNTYAALSISPLALAHDPILVFQGPAMPAADVDPESRVSVMLTFSWASDRHAWNGMQIAVSSPRGQSLFPAEILRFSFFFKCMQ